MNDQQATATVRGEVTTWNLDPAHTEIGFEVKHMMFAKVRGRFTDFEGSITLGPEGQDEASGAQVVIKAASIDTGQAQRDEHLRSADFFDVEQYPELTFQSRSVERQADGLLLHGDLTIRGTTREVTLTVSESGQGVDPWGNQRAGYSASGAIDRREFGLEWNQALEMGGVLVGNEVKLVIEAQAVLQNEEEA